MKNYKIILSAFLVGIAIFGAYKYVLFLKEKNDLLHQLSQMRNQLELLETEKEDLLENLDRERQLKQQLSQENIRLNADFKASEEKLAKLETDFKAAQETIEQLNTQISLLKAENSSLWEEAGALKLNLNQVSQEKVDLERRFNSLIELKKAIRELKQKMRLARKEIKPKIKPQTIEGNRGFLIKDGKSTYHLLKIKIEVSPAPNK